MISFYELEKIHITDKGLNIQIKGFLQTLSNGQQVVTPEVSIKTCCVNNPLAKRFRIRLSKSIDLRDGGPYLFKGTISKAEPDDDYAFILDYCS
ncbi:MAG: hypothetical protein Tsb0021_10780 [Chlamydiales bacterium]